MKKKKSWNIFAAALVELAEKLEKS